MKLISFVRDTISSVGVVCEDGDGIYDLAPLLSEYKSLNGLVENWEKVLPDIESRNFPRVNNGEYVLKAPIPNPRRNIICVGKNYLEHAAEFSNSGFDRSQLVANKDALPAIFTKATSSVSASGDLIDSHPTLTSKLDYEAELAIIIGSGGKGITRQNAMAHVWGYTLINDVTARDLQRDHSQWFVGKSLDTFCPMGPTAITADSVDPSNMRITSRVNGEIRQQAISRELIYDIPALIEILSAGMSLIPGDIIATGTPMGVGLGYDPPKFLNPGDRVEVENAEIGVLRNTVA